jgi:predicted SAM-dependent methyltransferase
MTKLNEDGMTEEEVESLKKALEEAKTTPSVKFNPEEYEMKHTRLNVGSGKDYREGYCNLEPHEMFKADMRMDIREAEFDENSLEEILAQDVIDHVTFVECKVLVSNFYKWLKPNGLLNIHLPNFLNISKWAAEGNHEAMTWIYGTDGKRAFYDTNLIRWSYTPESLKELLEWAGFIVFQYMDTCDGYGMRMMATKRV